jgi:hypothetical protein
MQAPSSCAFRLQDSPPTSCDGCYTSRLAQRVTCSDCRNRVSVHPTRFFAVKLRHKVYAVADGGWMDLKAQLPSPVFVLQGLER